MDDNMPLYEYRCEDCGRTFEKIRRIADTDRAMKCPHCESKAIKRLLSAFTTGGCGGGGNSRFT